MDMAEGEYSRKPLGTRNCKWVRLGHVGKLTIGCDYCCITRQVVRGRRGRDALDSADGVR